MNREDFKIDAHHASLQAQEEFREIKEGVLNEVGHSARLLVRVRRN